MNMKKLFASGAPDLVCLLSKQRVMLLIHLLQMHL